MSSKRCYHQFCGLAKAMDVVGERWTLLIIRDLLLGPWRYSDLQSRNPGITTNLLAKRLNEMEETGLIQKQKQSSVGSPHVYELTELGRKLEPAVLALGQFGFNFMTKGPEPGDQLDPGRALLNLKKRYLGKSEGAMAFEFINMPCAEEVIPYIVKYDPDYVDIRYGQSSFQSTKATLSLKTYGDLVFRGGSAQELEEKGGLTIT
ncbi:MAG: helix-turn-helix transcriptional regulator, partial [Gammaproteobacteria bacterium]|nr:helix-turn-helix transcriptional regulator [Gammaproteobacteria bacterium]